VVGKNIGHGAYASVKMVEQKGSKEKFAMKVYEKYKLNDQHKKKAVQREIQVLKRVDHPSVIKLHDHIDTARQISLVMDYVPGISLH